MSQPSEPTPVKLFASLFSPDPELLPRIIQELTGEFGTTDWVSPEIPFDQTCYYEREMGAPLFRRFIAFRELIGAEGLPEIKWRTNAVEREHLRGGARPVNIDPGYLTAERVILATGKNYIHRVYLARGIYADLTLIFIKDSFRPLDWTYPDYAAPATIEMFNRVRSHYREQLSMLKTLLDDAPQGGPQQP